MSTDIIYLALAVLSFALALNLKLTIAVLRTARRERSMPAALAAGQDVPPVLARTLDGERPVDLVAQGQPAVLLFLSSKCPKCRAKLPELARMAPGARQAGLALWLVSEEPRWRLRRFLRGSSLSPIAARVSEADYRLLNASLTSPAYFFIDHQGVLEAAGLIGDANWLALREQLAQADIGQAA